jgi:hypothetical protein
MFARRRLNGSGRTGQLAVKLHVDVVVWWRLFPPHSAAAPMRIPDATLPEFLDRVNA